MSQPPTTCEFAALHPSAVQGGEALADGYAHHLAAQGAEVVASDAARRFVELAERRTTAWRDLISYRHLDATDHAALLTLGARGYDAAVCKMALMDTAVIHPLLSGLAELLLDTVQADPACAGGPAAVARGLTSRLGPRRRPSRGIACRCNVTRQKPIGAIMIQGLRTVVYPTPDLAKGKSWYRQVLGRDPYFDEPFYVGFSVGGFELGLIPDGVPSGDGALAYWGVADIAAEVRRLTQLGGTLRTPVTDVGGGIKVAAVGDPFGNVFGVIENPHFDAKNVN